MVFELILLIQRKLAKLKIAKEKRNNVMVRINKAPNKKPCVMKNAISQERQKN
jgi:hypothetical protein